VVTSPELPGLSEVAAMVCRAGWRVPMLVLEADVDPGAFAASVELLLGDSCT
jgi:hypothetical protein